MVYPQAIHKDSYGSGHESGLYMQGVHEQIKRRAKIVPMNDDLTPEQLKKVVWNPMRNENAITIVKDRDGNYRGFMQKNGQFVQVRQGDPNTVLQLLITHE